MRLRIKPHHKTFFRVFLVYGMHVWLLIFISNVVIFYSIRFFIRASTTQQANISPTPTSALATPSATPTIPTPIPTAVGPVVDLSFSLSGIGTNGGNLKPVNTVKDVTIYLYHPDDNTADKNVKPVYTIKKDAIYDGDPNSPTYTFFVNHYIDLGNISGGNYQIVIKSTNTLPNLIKSTEQGSVGGRLFDLTYKRVFSLPSQTLINGDIYPDNVMDINDYNVLVSCFDRKKNPTKCVDSSIADLDDNGVVDGIDYNVMLLNYRTLLLMGLPIPRINITPTNAPRLDPFVSTPISNLINPSKINKNNPKITPTSTKSSSSASSIGIIIFILLILVIGIIFIIMFKLKLIKIPQKSPPSETPLPPGQEEEAAAEGSSSPLENTVASLDTDTIEKSGYLKKVSVDTQTNGTWVTLADDSGIMRGFYPNTNITDGFVKVKGKMKNDQENKPYIFITQLTTEG